MKGHLVWGESWAGPGSPANVGGRVWGSSWPSTFWEAFSDSPNCGVEGMPMERDLMALALVGCGEGGSHRWGRWHPGIPLYRAPFPLP